MNHTEKPADEVVEMSNLDIVKLNLAPDSHWSIMSDTDHFVQFYETDGFLLNSLSGFISSAINSRDAALVIATEQHRAGLDELLLANGVDLAKAKVSGQYLSLDASDTLSQFMVNGQPEPTRFKKVIGGIIASVTDGRERVRAFGEMVALLWAEGNYSGAIRLEELWNELQQSHSFSLFCAYPIKGFAGEQFITSHGDVCTAHSRVIPTESYPGLSDPDARLRAIVQLQQKANSLEKEIQERARAEEALRAALVREQMARSEAQVANRMKDEFLATVSHELRTPLNAIIGWSHLLRSGRLDEATITRALETIDRNAKSQAQLIEDILDVSRMITGKLKLNKEPVDLSAVINAAIDSVQLAADAKEIQLAVTLDPSARHTIGDSNRLQQVVWNLLANAIKFTPAGGHIAVKVERSGRFARLCVSDSGQGFSPEFLPFLFDRFRQADGTSTREHGGLGLGLSIVRQLVELHGGTIKAASEGSGKGATFIIKLPLAPPHKASARREGVTGRLALKSETTSVAVVPQLDGVRVLLVDDDPDTLQILSMMLEESKASVEIARSVREALEVLEWYTPDVLVSDLAMPDEDGYSLISKLREAENENVRQIPAVALTSYVRVEDRTRALTAGFNSFVPKPVQPEELVTAVANLAEPIDSST
ncbi:MAG TPA: ATP-binding protein [Pyrinomonadaceae bacterium]|nr:ATP-binding protein [Pyrinomonadaceae bacterium]